MFETRETERDGTVGVYRVPAILLNDEEKPLLSEVATVHAKL